jgi:hypothetical protein
MASNGTQTPYLNYKDAIAGAFEGLGQSSRADAGAYVKIPGLHPSESGALPYLSLEELEKLQLRVEQAIARAKRKAEEAASFLPGTRVSFKARWYRWNAGTQGIVVHEGNLRSQSTAGNVPVAIDGFGLTWVPKSHLRRGW